VRKTQVSDLRELPVQQGRRVILSHDHKCCDGGRGTQDAVGAEGGGWHDVGWQIFGERTNE